MPRVSTRRIPPLFLLAAVTTSGLVLARSPSAEVPSELSGRELYQQSCAACHGADGRGAPPPRVLPVPLPDFTDCNFASREPDADWVAVAHEGGPARGFSTIMPAFGGALTVEELQRIVSHIRTFCGDDAWPRGELNLPRPLVTEKAYPEDEAVFSTVVAGEGPGEVMNEVVYERRLGVRNQIEVVVPFGWRKEAPAGAGPGEGADWTSGLGDVAVSFKRAVYHRYERGSIFSVAGEIILPTGDEDTGFGKGTAVFEPFAAFGQILPADSFLQFQGGLELPLNTDRASEEAFWRVAVGKSFTQGGWGRVWTPMLEVLGARELEAGEDAQWDLLPELQVTLSTRQHVMANLGVRLPMTDAATRDTQVLVYLLWDWFDGGLFAGW